VILPHHYYADFVVWDKIMFEAKAVERLTDAHVKQVLNYLAISELELGLLVNFGADSLEWKRVIRSQKTKPAELAADFRL
jgi:GxxExxY protein